MHVLRGRHGEGNGNPLEYSCLENPLDRGAWQATVCGVTRVRHNLATKLLLLKFTLEKEMASHSSILAWRIPLTGEPGGLHSTGSQRVGRDWHTHRGMQSAQNRASPCLGDKHHFSYQMNHRCHLHVQKTVCVVFAFWSWLQDYQNSSHFYYFPLPLLST